MEGKHERETLRGNIRSQLDGGVVSPCFGLLNNLKKSANTTPTQIERVDNPTVSAVTVTPPPSYTLNKTQFCEHLLL